MRRDNEHCEVIIQDKLVEYHRTHTLEMAPLHPVRCSKDQICALKLLQGAHRALA